MQIDQLRGKVIVVNEGDRLQVDLGKIFKTKYGLLPTYLSTLPPQLMQFIVEDNISLLVAHPEVREQDLVIGAKEKIPVVMIRGRREFERDRDGKMFELFATLGIAVVDKTIYLNSHGYLIKMFAQKIIEELAKQL